MENISEDQRDSMPKWLQKLQENSWEPELLISGGAIFTLFQVSDIWITWLMQISTINPIEGYAFYMILGVLGLETLKWGFVLHLLLRAFWLSMVCINYVFPTGINKEKIKWKKPFKTSIEDKEDLQSPIIFIDKLCGTVMYLSVISAFLLAGIIFATFMLNVAFAPFAASTATKYVYFVFLSAFYAYIIDLIFGGLLRKIPYLSYLTFPFFTLYDYLTFRKIYQKSAFLFYTNVSKWKFALFASVFFAIAITVSYLNTYPIMRWPNLFDKRAFRWQMSNNEIELYYKYYKDELSEGELSPFCIPSKIIKDNYVELFIQYRVMFDEAMASLPDSKDKLFLSDISEISINDSIYKNVEWFRTVNKTTFNIGLTALIPIEHLKDGKHIIKIGYSEKVGEDHRKALEKHRVSPVYIPFWKDTEVTISK